MVTDFSGFVYRAPLFHVGQQVCCFDGGQLSRGIVRSVITGMKFEVDSNIGYAKLPPIWWYRIENTWESGHSSDWGWEPEHRLMFAIDSIDAEFSE